jgi:hypothetical protein
MRRFSLAENYQRRAIATTSGCAGAAREAASALALRAPSNAASRSAGWGKGLATDFIGLAMGCILPLYSNWSKAGVASHIGTQGIQVSFSLGEVSTAFDRLTRSGIWKMIFVARRIDCWVFFPEWNLCV